MGVAETPDACTPPKVVPAGEGGRSPKLGPESSKKERLPLAELLESQAGAQPDSDMPCQASVSELAALAFAPPGLDRCSRNDADTRPSFSPQQTPIREKGFIGLFQTPDARTPPKVVPAGEGGRSPKLGPESSKKERLPLAELLESQAGAQPDSDMPCQASVSELAALAFVPPMMTMLPPPRPPAKVGRKGKHVQRTLLDASDLPSPGFVQSFCASQKLSEALQAERLSSANGQAAYLKKKQQQLAYVEEAHRREQPPLEAIAAPEILRGELRRDAVFHHGAAGVPAPMTGAAALDIGDLRGGCIPIVNVGNEAGAFREKRLERQKQFLASRKARHDVALAEFDQAMDALAEDCQREVEAATERIKRDLEASTVDCNAILEPLEPPPLPPKAEGEEEEEDEAKLLDELEDLPMDGTIDPAKAKAVAAENAARKALRTLGERTEGEVRGILSALEAATLLRRRRIEEFAGPSGELARIDDLRKSSVEELLKTLVEALTAAAHVVHGEAERLIEERALSFNEILLENRKAMQQLGAKLTVQTLEHSKEYKVRWHKGLLLWKQQRHRHSMAVVMRRIKSTEFRQPESLVEAVGKVREHQAYVFRQRKDLIDELFAIPQHRLVVALVRHTEEQNTQLNDRAQETFDTLLVELRELREALNVSAEQMLGELGLELELHDARQEWKGHDSVANLIDAEVRPPLRECLDQVAALLHALSNKLTQQEEALHQSVTSVITFFLGLARKQELLKKRVEEFEVNYNGEVEDCEKDFEETCERNEKTMQDLHGAIDDAAHHETLDELKQQTFDHLDQMALGYRDHADQMLQIHNRYPGEAQDLIRRETRGYCKDLGLALDPSEDAPALAAERKAQTASLEEDAVNKAKAAFPAVPDEDEAAKATRLEALAAAVEAAKAEVQQAAEAREAAALEEEAQSFAGLEEKSGWPLGEGTGCRVLEKWVLEDLRQQILQPPESQGQEETPAEVGPEGESDVLEEPKFADGTEALDTLAFDNDWFEENLSSLRSAIFENLIGQKRYLDRVDIPAACEEVRRDLDQRLRRHTNRKGEVQVDWYVPRYSTVSKHKDKFERHLVAVAQKCQEQDDAVEFALQQIDEAEEQYKQRVAKIQEGLGDAETLPVLTSMERQVVDCMVRFRELCQTTVQGRLLELSSKAPQGLQKENQAFLMMCQKGEEQYSEPEIVYYGGEIEELNQTLDERKQERAQRAQELESQIQEKCKVPMDAFAVAYAAAVETLCASKGFGRKYGEPRRKAQERVRTLIARASTVRSNIQLLLDYVSQLLTLPPPEEGGYEVTAMPKVPRIMSVRHFFSRGGEPWTFTGELLGILYVAVCAMAELGSHLGAFRESSASKYELAAVPSLSILREDMCFLPSAEEQKEVHRKAEEAKDLSDEVPVEQRAEAQHALQLSRSMEASQALRDDSLLRVLGPLMKSERFNNEIQSVIKSSNEAYAGQARDRLRRCLHSFWTPLVWMCN
ncbi:Zc3h6 [Symbiodinium sp. KB8]|nr:Zc3h6 [Symbiodinium sp. KB8]